MFSGSDTGCSVTLISVTGEKIIVRLPEFFCVMGVVKDVSFENIGVQLGNDLNNQCCQMIGD